jgi:hypothetical protein
MKRTLEIGMTMALLATAVMHEPQTATNPEHSQQPTAATYEHVRDLGATALYGNTDDANWTVEVTLPQQTAEQPTTQAPDVIVAARIAQPLHVESFQADTEAPPTTTNKVQQKASLEGVTEATIDQVVSVINESVEPYKLYQIDPALIRDTASFLLHKGFTLQGTAAIVGALMTEHKLNTDGDGIVQWTGGRKAKINPQESDTVPEQLQKMVDEMQEDTYITAYEDLRNPDRTILQTINAMQRYEGAAILGRRGEFSHIIFALLLDGQANVSVMLNK